jgi:hypothetical protein
MAEHVSGRGAPKDRKQKGRTQVTKIPYPAPTHPMSPQDIRAATNRPVTASGNENKHRGDRRDTSRAYAGTARHAAHASNPRRDVSTRAR